MVCQNCGTQLPDGTPVCSTCGAALVAPQQPYMDPNQPVYSAAPAKKNNTGLIVGIIAAIVAIAIVAVVLVKVLGGSDYDGTYKFSKASMYGMEYTVEEMEAMSGESFDMTLTVKGSKCTLEAPAMGYDSASCKIKFDGDEVTLIDGDETLVGTYDADEKSITITASGVAMTFTLD